MALKQSKKTPLYIELWGEKIKITPPKLKGTTNMDEVVRILKGIANAPDPS